MTVDREQIAQDAARDFNEPADHRWHDEWLHSRRLARHCLALLAELEQAENESHEHFQRSMKLGYELGQLWPLAQAQAAAEWRSEAVEKIPALEASLAKVPALVEAAKARAVCDCGYIKCRCGGDALIEALAEWERE